MQRPSFSLSKKTLLSLFIILLPIVVVTAYNYQHNRMLLIEKIKGELNVIADAFEVQVYQFLEMNKRRAEDFASDGFIRDETVRISKGAPAHALNAHLSRNKLPLDSTVRAIVITEPGGRVIASTKESLLGSDFSGKGFFLNALAGKPTAEELIEGLGDGSGFKTLPASAVITNRRNGRTIGVITNFIAAAELDKLLSGEVLKKSSALSWNRGRGASMSVYIVNDKGGFVTKPLAMEAVDPTGKVETPPVRSCREAHEEFSGFYTDYRGVEVAGAAMCLPTLGWTLLVEVDASETLASVADMRTNALITSALVIGLIVLIFATFFRNIISQLQGLSSAAHEIAGGRYDVTIPVRTSDEIGCLSAAFNGMASDIKERTLKLAERESQLREAQHIAHLGSWVWDIAADRIEWSDEVYSIFGIGPGAEGPTYEDFLSSVHPDDRRSVMEAVDAALGEKRPCSIEYRIVRPDQTERVVHERAEVRFDAEGKPVRMIGTVMDITDRKAAEREIEEMARFASENPYPVLRISTDGRVLYSNVAGEPMLKELGTEVGGVLPDEWIEHASVVARTLKSSEVEIDVRERSFSLVLTPVEDAGYVNVYGIEITQRKRDLMDLKKLSAAIEQSVNLIFITDVNGTIEYVNPTFEQVTGYSRADAIGQKPSILSSGDLSREHYEDLWNTILQGKTWRRSYKNKKKDGGYYWCNAIISPIKNEAGEVTHFLSVQEDITDKMRSEEHLRYLAQHDELTGLLNRSRFIELTDEWVADARMNAGMGALMLIDLDQFKFMNDTYGHGTGDEFLRRLSRLLKTTVRLIYREYLSDEKDDPFVGRLSGDEFVIFLPHVETQTAEKIAERLRKTVEGFRIPGISSSVTISCGLVSYPAHGDDPASLLTRADAAMYRAKELGRNRVHTYRPEDRDLEKMHSRLTWKERVLTALAENRFVPWFQPILDIRDGTVRHYEALARLVDVDGKILFPGSFIDIAERFGIISSIDRMIIEKTLSVQAAQRALGRNLSFSMNLSGKDLGNEEFLVFLKETMAQKGMVPGSIIFEITETEAIADLDRAKEFICALKAIGCRFSLDDFGVGFTSFTYLKELSVDYIKIDGSFIRKLDENPDDQVFVKAMSDVARGLGIKTVAEFVEKEEVLDLLKEFGVTYAQGYLIGKPGPDIL